MLLHTHLPYQAPLPSIYPWKHADVSTKMLLGVNFSTTNVRIDFRTD